MPNYPVGRIFDGYRGKFYTCEIWERCAGAPRLALRRCRQGVAPLSQLSYLHVAIVLRPYKAGQADCSYRIPSTFAVGAWLYLFKITETCRSFFYVADLWPDAYATTLS